MSTAPRYTPHYTVADYQQWDGDWELWSGTAVSMSPSPFGIHGHLASRIITAFCNAIDSAQCDATVIAEVDWIVSQDTVIRPDVTVLCGSAPERHVERTPELIVEVLSDSTRDRDLNHKRELYRRQSVRWYLILDPNDLSLLALRLDAAGIYQAVAYDQSLQVDLCEDCSLAIDLRRVFK